MRFDFEGRPDLNRFKKIIKYKLFSSKHEKFSIYLEEFNINIMIDITEKYPHINASLYEVNNKCVINSVDVEDDDRFKHITDIVDFFSNKKLQYEDLDSILEKLCRIIIVLYKFKNIQIFT